MNQHGRFICTSRTLLFFKSIGEILQLELLTLRNSSKNKKSLQDILQLVSSVHDLFRLFIYWLIYYFAFDV